MKILNNIIKQRISLFIALSLLMTFVSFGGIYAITSNSGKNKPSHQAICKDTCVALHEDGASPDVITVVVGSYVQFNSADGKSHDLSLGEGGEEHVHTGKFSSGEFKADEAWRVQLNEEGSFSFHDHLNPKISILVVVYTAGKQYKIE